MIQANSICNRNWTIKALDGQFLSVIQGQIMLTDEPNSLAINWQFKPSEQLGRFYIEHVQTGERLVDVVNGGFDSWSVEQAFNGHYAFISQGGVFSHFDYVMQDLTEFSPVTNETNCGHVSGSSKKRFCHTCQHRLTEYCHWLLE